jgi:hypothetical protein
VTSPTATIERVVIGERFNGPPASANGGYACGQVARLVDGPAQVSLRRPVPLGRELTAERHADGSVTLRDGDVLIAEGGPALPLDLEPPRRPALAEARDTAGEPWASDGEFSGCWVCSARRDDGLGVTFGALDGSTTAAVLHAGEPGEELPADIVWAALDCPSYTPELWDAPRPSLLATMTAELLEPVPAGEPLVVVGWSLGSEGRKHESATAVLGADGRTLARARALWIQPREI